MEALLGSNLESSAADVPTHRLEGKIVGLLFGAQWCSPCRAFTSVLEKFYNNVNRSEKLFEIVYISSDRDHRAFEKYFGGMPWLALPFEKVKTKSKLTLKYNISGVPALVLLDGRGKLINTNGRELVTRDPLGDNFPWGAKSFETILGSHFIKANGDEVDSASLEGKVLGFYFGAYWCTPCVDFTPLLARTYNRIQRNGGNFEIIFCSSDRDVVEFDNYFDSMPWLAVPFGDARRRRDLSTFFEIREVPVLLLADSRGQVISTNGRGAVLADPRGSSFPWFPLTTSSSRSRGASRSGSIGPRLLRSKSEHGSSSSSRRQRSRSRGGRSSTSRSGSKSGGGSGRATATNTSPQQDSSPTSGESSGRTRLRRSTSGGGSLRESVVSAAVAAAGGLTRSRSYSKLSWSSGGAAGAGTAGGGGGPRVRRSRSRSGSTSPLVPEVSNSSPSNQQDGRRRVSSSSGRGSEGGSISSVRGNQQQQPSGDVVGSERGEVVGSRTTGTSSPATPGAASAASPSATATPPVQTPATRSNSGGGVGIRIVTRHRSGRSTEQPPPAATTTTADRIRSSTFAGQSFPRMSRSPSASSMTADVAAAGGAGGGAGAATSIGSGPPPVIPIKKIRRKKRLNYNGVSSGSESGGIGGQSQPPPQRVVVGGGGSSRRADVSPTSSRRTGGGSTGTTSRRRPSAGRGGSPVDPTLLTDDGGATTSPATSERGGGGAMSSSSGGGGGVEVFRRSVLPRSVSDGGYRKQSRSKSRSRSSRTGGGGGGDRTSDGRPLRASGSSTPVAMDGDDYDGGADWDEVSSRYSGYSGRSRRKANRGDEDSTGSKKQSSGGGGGGGGRSRSRSLGGSLKRRSYSDLGGRRSRASSDATPNAEECIIL